MYTPIPSSTLRTWNMVPHPMGEMLSSMNSPNKPRSRKWEKTQKPKIRPVFYYVFHNFTKNRILSYGRYAHFGIRVRPKSKKRVQARKKEYMSQNNSLKLKGCFFEKVEIWCKYVNIGEVWYNIEHFTYNIKYLIHKMRYLLIRYIQYAPI